MPNDKMQFEGIDFGQEFLELSFQDRMDIITEEFNEYDRGTLFGVHMDHIMQYGTMEQKIYWQGNYMKCLNVINDVSINRAKSQCLNKDNEAFRVMGNFVIDYDTSITYEGYEF